MDAAKHDDSDSAPFTVTSMLTPLLTPVNNFSSFMMFFNDMFIQDEYYSNFNMVTDIPTSDIIGEGNQSVVRRMALNGGMAVRTSHDPKSRKTSGDNIVLKKIKTQDMDERDGDWSKSTQIADLVRELRIFSHPPLRSHEHILDIYGYGWELEGASGTKRIWPVLMIEYAAHGTLQDFLDSGKAMYLEQKLAFVSNISAGLSALHVSGIVHADLKPENILVCETDNGIKAKLTDFGYSCILKEVDWNRPWAGGTLGWRPPEWNILIQKEDFYKVDVYALGLVFWTVLLDGRAPWDHDTTVSDKLVRKLEFEKLKETEAISIKACEEVEVAYFDMDSSFVVSALGQMLQKEAKERSYELLSGYKASASAIQPVALGFNKDIKDSAPPETPEREMFSDYSVLLTLPDLVQKQLHSSLVETGNQNSDWRGAEACYALSTFHILCIGTVRLLDEERPHDGYTGYEMDAMESFQWLKKAAEKGSSKAQATYYRMSKALSIEVDATENSRILDWLEKAAFNGDHIASQDLKELDYERWILTRQAMNQQSLRQGKELPGALVDAIKSHDLEIFKSLVQSPSYGDWKTATGDNVLSVASMFGFLDAAMWLLTDASVKVDINQANDFNETAALIACRAGHVEVLDFLLDMGASGAISNVIGENPLHWLSSLPLDTQGILDIATKLKDAGADTHKVCDPKQEFDPRHLDVTLSNQSTKMFFSNGLYKHQDINDLSGTPLRRATLLNNKAAVEALLKLGASPYGGETGSFPVAEACLLHLSDILELFLPPNFEVIHPGWYKKPYIRARDLLELIPAVIGRAKSMQSAAPRHWAYMEQMGTAKSLLGYAVSPRLVNQRMLVHGPAYNQQMKRTLDLIRKYGQEDHLCVSPALSSSILEATLGGDLNIVAYVLEIFPEVHPLLASPRPSGYALWLPIHAAIAQRNKLVFDCLVKAAGPNQPLGPPSTSGISNWLIKKRFELGGETIGTCPAGHQISNVLQLCGNATSDPHFARAILERVANPQALIMTRGYFGEMPITVALSNARYELADLLMLYGADLAIGGRPGPSFEAMAAGIGLSWSDYWAITKWNSSLDGSLSVLGWILKLNNDHSTETVKWLLSRGVEFIVDPALRLSAFHSAVGSGFNFGMDPEKKEYTHMYGCNLSNLRILLDHFKGQEYLDFKAFNGWTALHIASLRLDIGAVEMLKNAGASLDITSDSGETPLEYVESLVEVPSPITQRGLKAVDRYKRRITEMKQLLQC